MSETEVVHAEREEQRALRDAEEHVAELGDTYEPDDPYSWGDAAELRRRLGLPAWRLGDDPWDETCDWGQCTAVPVAGAFCDFHADEYERVQMEKNT